MDRIDRIDLELYADRLARHADRLLDDIRAARTRAAWTRLETTARRRLAGDDCRTLEAIGVLGEGGSSADDLALVERRTGQLAALERLQAVVEAELAAARRHAGGPAP